MRIQIAALAKPAARKVDDVFFLHPEDVVSEPSLATHEKRAILAAWASDAHAVENMPTLRRLESGAIVKLDDIIDALKRLDRF
jgi:hypothetical protein